MAVKAYAGELEREMAREPTHCALLRKAQAGHVTRGAFLV